MKNRTVYLAGKVTGLWRWYVVLKFSIYDLFLTLMGYEVWNPVREIRKDTPWIDAITICCYNLKKCEYVYFQPDWWLSEGAKVEFSEAAKYDKKLLNSGYKIISIYNYLSTFEKSINN